MTTTISSEALWKNNKDICEIKVEKKNEWVDGHLWL